MFEHILIPLDGSHLAECVLPHALAIAQAFESKVTLLRVLERSQTTDRPLSVDPLGWHIRKTEAEAYLSGVAARLQELGLRVEHVLREGPAAEQIIEFAHSTDASLIILSSHGLSGLSGWNISGVVQKIILRAYASVMIVRAYLPSTLDLKSARYRRLLAPLDCSQRAECVLQHVTALAQFHESEVLLAHVVRRPELVRRSPPTQEDIELVNQLTERNRLEAAQYLKLLQSQTPLKVETRLLVSDNVAGTLHELVKQESADLVVLCAHGHSGGIKWPYGNVTLNFIAYGSTPLLIVQDISQHEAESTEAEIAAREYKGH